MLVSEFVTKLNDLNKGGATNLKDKFLEERITRKYVPIAEKTGKLRVALNSSIISPDGGVPYVDMVLNKILYFYTVIRLYTDLEAPLDKDGKIDTLGLYDCLKENQALGIILDAIGDDLSECLFINEQVLDTWHLQNSSTRAFISNTIKDFSGLSDAFAKKLEDAVKNLPETEDKNKQ